MSYQSISFIAFSLLAVALYYLLGKKMQVWVLAAANLAFYIIAGVEYLPYLLVTMLATYFAGLIISRIYNKTDLRLEKCTEMSEKKELRAKAKKKAKRVLVIALLIAIALLAVCKYTAFAFENINAVLKSFDRETLTPFKVIMPLGISYYTFMAISYALDIYWKRYKAEKNFLYYAVFLSYFPHVVQGPIDRYNEFKEQIKDGISFKSENLAEGSQ